MRQLAVDDKIWAAFEPKGRFNLSQHCPQLVQRDVTLIGLVKPGPHLCEDIEAFCPKLRLALGQEFKIIYNDGDEEVEDDKRATENKRDHIKSGEGASAGGPVPISWVFLALAFFLGRA